MKKYIYDYALLFLIAGTVVLLDQLSKYTINIILPMGMIFHPEWYLTMYARLVHVTNQGAVYSTFQGNGGFLTLLSFIVGGAIIIIFPRIPQRDWAVRLGLGLLLGGAAGNLVDRLHQGYITDFISIGNLPVFNISDLSIAIGLVFLFIGILRKEEHPKSPQVAVETEADDSDKTAS